jgi:hypothetical protein
MEFRPMSPGKTYDAAEPARLVFIGAGAEPRSDPKVADQVMLVLELEDGKQAVLSMKNESDVDDVIDKLSQLRDSIWAVHNGGI